MKQVRGGVAYAKDPRFLEVLPELEELCGAPLVKADTEEVMTDKIQDKFEALMVEAGVESADDDFIDEYVPSYLEEFHAIYKRHKGYPISSTNADIVVLTDPYQRIDRRLQALFGILVELFAILKQLTDDERHSIFDCPRPYHVECHVSKPLLRNLVQFHNS